MSSSDNDDFNLFSSNVSFFPEAPSSSDEDEDANEKVGFTKAQQFALQKNDLAVIKLLMKPSLVKAAHDSEGQNSLHLSLGSGTSNSSVIQYLLDCGCDVNKQEAESHHTPLMKLIVQGGQYENEAQSSIAKALINGGANLELTCKVNYNNVLHLICKGIQLGCNQKLIELILEASPNLLQSRNKKGNTPLHILCKQNFTSISNQEKALTNQKELNSIQQKQKEQHFQIQRLQIIKSFQAINKKNGFGMVNLENDNGQEPLHLACIHNGATDVELIKYLINNGSNVNLNDETQGFTPLHYLCCYSGLSLQVLELFKVKNYDFQNITTKKRSNILHLLCRQEKPNCEILRFVIENKLCKIDQLTENQKTEFLLICKQKGLELKHLKLLIEIADCNFNYNDERNRNGLFFICQTLSDLLNNDETKSITGNNNNKITINNEPSFNLQKWIKIFEYLLNKGINVNSVDQQTGLTPLLILCNSSNKKNLLFIKLLLKHGCKIGLTSHYSEYTEIQAVLKQKTININLFTLLIDNGASFKYSKGTAPIFSCFRLILNDEEEDNDEDDDDDKNSEIENPKNDKNENENENENDNRNKNEKKEKENENKNEKEKKNEKENEKENENKNENDNNRNDNKCKREGDQKKKTTKMKNLSVPNEIISRILKLSDNLNQRDGMKNSVLHNLCMRHHLGTNCIDLIKTFINKKVVDINIKGQLDQTALHLISEFENIDPNVVELLCDSGVDVNLIDQDNKTALNILIMNNLQLANVMSSINLILSKGYDLSYCDPVNNENILIQILNKKYSIAKHERQPPWQLIKRLLKDEQLDVQLRCQGGKILHLLCELSLNDQNYECMQICLQRGVDINYYNIMYLTPIMVLLKSKMAIDVKFIQLFLEYKAKLNCLQHVNDELLMNWGGDGHLGRRYYFDMNRCTSALHIFCERSNPESGVLELLLSNYKDINEIDALNGTTALYHHFYSHNNNNNNTIGGTFSTYNYHRTRSYNGHRYYNSQRYAYYNRYHNVNEKDKYLEKVEKMVNYNLIELFLQNGAKTEFPIYLENTNSTSNQYTILSSYLDLFKFDEKMDFDIIKLLIDYGADLNYSDHESEHPFILLANNSNLENKDIIVYFIKKGSNLNYNGNLQGTPFFYICQNYGDDFDLLKLCFDYNADPNVLNCERETAFHMVLFNKNLNKQILKLFFRNNTNMLIDNKVGYPLHILEYNSNLKLEFLNFFLKLNLSLELKNKSNKFTILLMLCYALKYSDGLLQEKYNLISYLIECGANVNSLSIGNNNCLHLLATMGLKNILGSDFVSESGGTNYNSGSSRGGVLDLYAGNDKKKTSALKNINNSTEYNTLCLKIIKILIDKKININQLNIKSQTPLHFFCLNHPNMEIINLLLANGANAQLLDKNNNSILHYLLKSKQVSLKKIKFLFQNYKLDLNVQNLQKESPISIYCRHQNINLETLLFFQKMKADFSILNNNQYSLFQIAIRNPHINIQCAKFLYQFDQNINFVSKIDSENAFSYYCSSKNVDFEIIKFFVDNGSNVNINTQSEYIPSPIYKLMSINFPNFLIVNYVIRNVVDINQTNHLRGNSLLHRVILNSNFNFKIFELLIDKNIDVNIKNRFQDSVLKLLHQKKLLSMKTLGLLIKANINLNLQDAEGRTVLFYSVYDVLNVLLKRKREL
ncbi:ankyrin repeat [Anaeramoeba flamelloides]|uniref:Ankyrin repeat n=1 Tax=Anaeramoeba flamelloides TaxID=1746091 RepID=A0ABQ8YNL5_9EUKA|nr:ankyrin repeat [Anaeramoeba flamelloides]